MMAYIIYILLKGSDDSYFLLVLREINLTKRRFSDCFNLILTLQELFSFDKR